MTIRMFVVTKIILFMLLPPASLILLMGTGLLLLIFRKRSGKVLITAGVVLLYLFSIGPVSELLLKPLESRFQPITDIREDAAKNIVVLGGGAVDLHWLGAAPAPSSVSIARLVHAVAIHRRVSDSIIIISGGSGNPAAPHLSEARTMMETALSLGIARERMIIEEASRNTVESAHTLKKILGNEKIILVTSASHMVRAAGMFKKAGFEVIAAPCNYMSEQRSITLYSLIPHASSLEASSSALYEYLGLVWYSLRGEL